MQNKYIKVTEKDKTSFIVLASNEAFYKSRGATIAEATKEEIEKAFPEEMKFVEKVTDAKAFELEKAAHEETKQKLEAEILAHSKTKQKLEEAIKAKKEKTDKTKANPDENTNENQTQTV